jgi:hypothetical protein
MRREGLGVPAHERAALRRDALQWRCLVVAHKGVGERLDDSNLAIPINHRAPVISTSLSTTSPSAHVP